MTQSGILSLKKMFPTKQKHNCFTKLALYTGFFGGSTLTGLYVFTADAGLFLKGAYLVGGLVASIFGTGLGVAAEVAQNIVLT